MEELFASCMITKAKTLEDIDAIPHVSQFGEWVSQAWLSLSLFSNAVAHVVRVSH